MALGGNALLPRGGPLDFATQLVAARAAARALAPVIAAHHVVITHGNGPQVGVLALQAGDSGAWPLDVLVAETEGMIGYVLETELERVVEAPVLSILTRVQVDPDDPAFTGPTKPIGPVYPDTESTRREADAHGWVLAPDTGGLRRVVPSPEPIGIDDVELIARLGDDGVVVICAGGGGIPVAVVEGEARGVEAVVDKDLTSALLATLLDADLLVCLTDVDGVHTGWGTDQSTLLRDTTPDELRGMRFDAGSMGPKVEAACRFVEATGQRAAIGPLEAAAAIVAGSAGTSVTAVSP